MGLNREIWTVVVVTVLTVLIWAWAATATQEDKTVTATVSFFVDDPDAEWTIEPSRNAPRVTLEGSKAAISRAEEILRSGLELEISRREPGMQEINLSEAIRASEVMAATGVAITATNPPTVTLDLDRVVQVKSARIEPRLPGVQTIDLKVEPTAVVITMPGLLRELHSGDLAVEAVVRPEQLLGLSPGTRHELDAVLRLPQPGLQSSPAVTISPSSVTVSFTILSQTREYLLDTVRVQVASSPENFREYAVEPTEQTLRQVTIEADADLIGRIEARQMYVVAMLHLSLSDLEQGLTRKAVTYFAAVPAVGSDQAGGELVQFKSIADTEELPVIHFAVSRHSPPAS